jgi:UDP-galactopyranose mutase
MPESESRPDYGIIVHCHLRWDFVWQRPQHIMSRLCRFHPILFIDPPEALPPGATEGSIVTYPFTEGLTVARLSLLSHTGDPERDAEIDKKNLSEAKRLLDSVVADLGWERIVHWYYNPMYGATRGWYDPTAIVYDCMDELANFKYAPPEIKQREEDLMAAADVVFTGGPSMYQARNDKHANVHQFNSGVDVEHFQKAQDTSTVVPEDAANLPHPVLLYYGVIDERMGWDNLEAIADAHPDWSILMVGPLAKITEDDLLRRPNIHYTGQRGYNDLPGYLKGCDVALVPFNLSDATRYLSPTKTLEYFAARKPVVSTPILDIVEHYSDAARIAADPQEFVKACEAALAENDAARIERGVFYANQNTWDNIVTQMRDLLDAAVARNLGEPFGASEAGNESTGTGGEMSTGHVRWYSGSRGVGLVDTEQGDEVMAFLPGDVQEDLGAVREGDVVAVNPAGPGHVAQQADESGVNMFPLGLDKLLGTGSPGEQGTEATDEENGKR